MHRELTQAVMRQNYIRYTNILSKFRAHLSPGVPQIQPLIISWNVFCCSVKSTKVMPKERLLTKTIGLLKWCEYFSKPEVLFKGRKDEVRVKEGK